MWWTRWLAVPLVLLAAASVSVAQTGLELIDGRVLEGLAVECVDDGYRLSAEPPPRESYEHVVMFGPQRPVVARNTVDLAWWPSSDRCPREGFPGIGAGPKSD